MRSQLGVAAMLAVVVLAAGVVRGESASTLLEKGVYLEETAGDLDGAIQVYKQVAADSQASGRHAAQALYRLGSCQLKKKQAAEAVESFRKVVKLYPEQKELVEQANRQLTAAGAANGNGTSQRRAVGKAVVTFPEVIDLSTPETACVAWNRASARLDAQAIAAVSWHDINPAKIEAMKSRSSSQDWQVYSKALLAAPIVEVWTYKDDFAGVIAYLPFPPGQGRNPYSLRYLGQKDGQWKNYGEDRTASLAEARQTFQKKQENIHRNFLSFKKGVAAGTQPDALAGITIRRVDKTIAEFPQVVDLSTPEAACAAYHRAFVAQDAQAFADLSWHKSSPAQLQQMFESIQANDPDGIYLSALAHARIVQVLTYRDDLADVIIHLPFPAGKGRAPYSSRGFGLVNGQWKNIGEDRYDSIEEAVGSFDRKKDNIRRHFLQLIGQGDAAQAEAAIPRQQAIEQVLANPEPIVTIAESIFESIRTAEYDRWLNGEGWSSFPIRQHYQTYKWYDVLVPWICKTFKEDPIQSVALGQVYKMPCGLPAIPYKLTLASGRAIEGQLPFDYNASGAWYAKCGLDWHLGENPWQRAQPAAPRSGAGARGAEPSGAQRAAASPFAPLR